jgi:hypothetical protein
MKTMVKGIPFWKTKTTEAPKEDALKSLTDKEIAKQVAVTLGFPEKAPDNVVELEGRVRLSLVEKRARREKNRARAAKRSQRPTKPHGRQ